MTEPGIALLEKLLRLSERSPDRIRSASASPDYDKMQTAGAVERFEAQIAAAEKAGAVVVRRGQRERRHLIDRVTVSDSNTLARHLGRVPARVTAASARQVLEPVIHGADPWVGEILNDLVAKWERGDPAFRISPNDLKLAEEFLTLLASISLGQCRGLDARTFALRATGDSKALDRHSTRVCSVLAERLGYQGGSADQVWHDIGLERFGHPVHVSGPIVVKDGPNILVDGRAKPFASLHPEMISLVHLVKPPTVLLTIENYASFNRYVREVQREDLVVYTAGFPSAAVIDFLSAILSNIGSEIRFFHWGDVDPGGVRIFRFLEQNLPLAPEPHLMSRALAEQRGRPAERDVSLASIAATASAIAGLAEWLARGEGIRHLEQEALDPTSPP